MDPTVVLQGNGEECSPVTPSLPIYLYKLSVTAGNSRQAAVAMGETALTMIALVGELPMFELVLPTLLYRSTLRSLKFIVGHTPVP